MRQVALASILAAALGLMAACGAKSPGMLQARLGMTVLNSVAVSDNSVEIEMSAEFSSSYTVERTADPFIAVVEIPGVALGDTPEKIISGKAGIAELRFSMVQTPALLTRLEVVLREPLDILPSKTGRTLTLRAVRGGAEQSRAEAKPLAVVATLMPTGEEVIELLPATEISSIDIKPGEIETRIVISGDGAMDPQIFTLPGRIIIDVPGVAMKAVLPTAMSAPVKGVRYGSYGDKVRIVLDLTHEGDFVSVAEDNTIAVSVPVKETQAVAFGGKATVAEIVAKAKTPARENGETTVPTEAAAPAAVSEKPAVPAGAPVPALPLDAAEEAEEAEAMAEEEVAEAPEEVVASEEAKGMRTIAAGDAGRLVEDEKEAYKKKYKGKLISLDFQDAEIVPIYRFLAEIGGYNVVIHPSVSGKITLKLTDVPWDHAMDIILELSNQGKQIEGNILRIAPGKIFVEQKEEAARLKASSQKAAELQQVAIHLKYISAAEMKKRIDEAKAVMSKESAGAGGADRGTIRIDERTNTIIVNETPENLKRILDVEVPYWDKAEHGPLQVLIEAKVVSVSTSYTHNLGVRWGGSATNENFSFISDEMTFDASVNTPVGQAGTGAAVPGGLLTVGYAETFNLRLSLSALETMQKAKSLANPRVLTMDKQGAQITKGTSIPYTTQAEGGGTKIQTQDATLSLNVTPEVQPNGIIKLDIQVNNDSPTTIPGADAPGIDKQQIKTMALVKSGETLVLGGIYTNKEEETEVRVPLLYRIPVLGWLFKTRQVSRTPSELLIFITPQIVRI